MNKTCKTPISGLSPSKNAEFFCQCRSENSMSGGIMRSGMNKKPFSAPTLELTVLDRSDIITTSDQEKDWSEVYPV